MLKLIKADFYKSFHRPYLFVLTGILAALAVLFSLSYFFRANSEVAISLTQQFFVCLPFLAVMIADVVLAEEIKFGSLKNTVVSGMSRSTIFIGKSIAAMILTLICAVVTLVFFFAGALIFMHPGEGFTAAFITDYMLRVAISLLIVAGSIMFAMLLATIFKKNAVYAFAFAGLIFVPTLIFTFLGALVSPVFNYFMKATLIYQASVLKDIPSWQFNVPILVALAHIVICGILGVIIFKKQEVN